MHDFIDLVSRVRAHASEDPDAPALAWFDDRAEVVAQRTRGEYLTRCEALAGALLSRGCRPGEPALLIHPPGLAFFEAFLACLIAGIVPVPAYPPDPLGRGPRLAFIDHVCAEIGIRHALTTARYNNGRRLGNVRHLLRRSASWPRLEWLATDKLSGRAPPPRRPAPEDLAFIQFTSGSTHRPRGVQITHRNVIHQITVNRARLTPEHRVVVWLPQYHDFGLVNAFLCALGGGAPLWMCSPLDFLKNPAVWPEMMHRVGATHTASPDFGYAFATRKTTPEQRARWDLSTVQCAGSGGEAVRPETVEAFAEAFAPSGFPRAALQSGWGLAEHVVGATGGVIEIRTVDHAPLRRGEALRPVPPDHPRAQRIASSGHPFPSV
jgi:acyl-CoA synthetase (AMP-forming)/AMP-acid ligase II